MSLRSMGRMVRRDNFGQVKYHKCCVYRGGKRVDCIKPATMLAVKPVAGGFGVVEMGADKFGIVSVQRIVAVLAREVDADSMARRLTETLEPRSGAGES